MIKLSEGYQCMQMLCLTFWSINMIFLSELSANTEHLSSSMQRSARHSSKIVKKLLVHINRSKCFLLMNTTLHTWHSNIRSSTMHDWKAGGGALNLDTQIKPQEGKHTTNPNRPHFQFHYELFPAGMERICLLRCVINVYWKGHTCCL